MKKIWILFSQVNGWDERKGFHRIFWEKPDIETLSSYLSYSKSPRTTVMAYDFLKVIKGEKTYIYGEFYWIEEFVEPQNQENDKTTKVTVPNWALITD